MILVSCSISQCQSSRSGQSPYHISPDSSTQLLDVFSHQLAVNTCLLALAYSPTMCPLHEVQNLCLPQEKHHVSHYHLFSSLCLLTRSCTSYCKAVLTIAPALMLTSSSAGKHLLIPYFLFLICIKCRDRYD